MISFLTFATIFLFVLAVLALLAGFDALAHPFKDRLDWAYAILLSLVVAPLVATLAFQVNGIRRDYCPPIEPIAAPDIAEAEGVPVVIEDLSVHEQALIESAKTIDSLQAELAAKTSALQTASQTILELTNRVKTLEAVRIDAPRATQTPIQQPTTTRPPCRGPRCSSGG